MNMQESSLEARGTHLHKTALGVLGHSNTRVHARRNEYNDKQNGTEEHKAPDDFLPLTLPCERTRALTVRQIALTSALALADV